MIAINWFEVTVPASVDIPFLAVDPAAPLPRRQRSPNTRSVYIRQDSGIFYVTAKPPVDVSIRSISLQDYPGLASHIIELGFTGRLREAQFDVRMAHVGGVGLIRRTDSIRPRVYESLEGIGFRSFYGFGPSSPRRFGLVLSYRTSQRFTLSLADSNLCAFAIGKKVVRRGTVGDASVDAGIFVGTSGQTATIIDRDNASHPINPAQWTLPCSKHNLLAFLRRFESAEVASKVSSLMQRGSMATTSEGKINSSLAKDQLLKLKSVLQEHELTRFTAPLPGRHPLGLSSDPLIIGETV